MKIVFRLFFFFAALVALGTASVYASGQVEREDAVILRPGDVIRITEPVWFRAYVPASGTWLFEGTDHTAPGFKGPFLELFDGSGYRMGSIESAQYLWARLEAGNVYYLHARFWEFDPGDEYTLIFRQVYATAMPPTGSLRISEETLVSFMPDSSGIWIVETSMSTVGAELDIAVFRNNWQLRRGNDLAWHVYPRIMVWMQAGREYHVHAGFYGESYGEYELSIRQLPAYEMPPDGSIRISEASVISFTPDVSGFWAIEAEHVWGGSPWFTLYLDGREMWQRPGMGVLWIVDGIVHTWMQAGREYHIHAIFYYTDFGEFDLSVRPVPVLPMPPSGSVEINEVVVVSFIPDADGIWEFVASEPDTGNYPVILLFEDDRNLGFDWWQFDRVSDFLRAGREYTVLASFMYPFAGSYILSVTHTPLKELPAGGSLLISGEENLLSFVPDATGFWVIELSGHGTEWNDILIRHVDAADRFDTIEWGSDRIEVFLHEGIEYIVDVSVFGPDEIADVFSISAFFVPVQDLQPNSELQVSGVNSFFSFVPSETGFWAIEISELDLGRAEAVLRYADADFSDGFAWGGNLLKTFLYEGVEYVIEVRIDGAWWAIPSYSIGAFLLPSQDLFPDSSVRITESTIVGFVPDVSGHWAFESSEFADGAVPWLRFYVQGELIRYFSRQIVHFLYEGEEVTIVASVQDYETYTLSAFSVQELELELRSPGVVIIERYAGQEVLLNFVPDFTANWEVEVSAYESTESYLDLEVFIIRWDYAGGDDEYELLAYVIWNCEMNDASAVVSATAAEGGTYIIYVWNPQLERLALTLRALP